MTDFLNSYKTKVDANTVFYLQSRKQPFVTVSPWSQDVMTRLIHFIPSGKTLRGSLICYLSHAFGLHDEAASLAAASALEIIHAGLLIHDDIMDKDDLRRGRETITRQYTGLGQQKGFRDSGHFGVSMGICTADLCYFMAWELLHDQAIALEEQQLLSRLFSREFAYVCLAQMDDIANGLGKTAPDIKNIVTTYRYKTARYTFSLPCMSAAILAHQTPDTIGTCEKLGEYMGILYQIKDDELSVSGDTRVTGKPVGGDKRENKKTLRNMYKQSGSDTPENLKKEYLKRSQQCIHRLPIEEEDKTTLLRFAEYICERQS